MFCGGIYSYKDLKTYFKSYLQLLCIPKSDTSGIFTLDRDSEINYEWENITTPRGQ